MPNIAMSTIKWLFFDHLAPALHHKQMPLHQVMSLANLPAPHWVPLGQVKGMAAGITCCWRAWQGRAPFLTWICVKSTEARSTAQPLYMHAANSRVGSWGCQRSRQLPPPVLACTLKAREGALVRLRGVWPLTGRGGNEAGSWVPQHAGKATYDTGTSLAWRKSHA